ncbi:DNRLRE domain-containing protein [Sphaerisporangium sp. NPDC005289]|uniref:DNRLRE domain-containing protein n=1 Tax=Sphaerisporangium sp. NPDC005289 TaxID=3155247 RepID=UPI0033A434B8
MITVSTLAASLLAAGGMPSASAGTKPPTSPAQSDPIAKAAPFPRPADPDADLRAGIAEARKQNKPVEVTAAASETSRTWAYPDGHLTTESYSSPAQVKRPDGTWAWMDTALVEKDGALEPRVAKAHVRFSLGGDGPFATMERDKGQKFSLSWGKTLPRPVVKGNVATYVNAAGPSADLVVTALSTGFSHDVVLRERPTSPVELRIPVQSSGVTFGKSKHGGLQLTDSKNKVVAEAPKPVMWDNVAPDQNAGRVAARRIGDISTSVERENGRQVLVLRPDADWLADPATHYPVTIDPTTTLNVTTDTTIGSRAECSPFDTLVGARSTVLTVGGAMWNCSGTDGFQYYRSYLKFDTSALAGKAIYSAALQLWRTEAPACYLRGDGKVRLDRPTNNWSPGSLTWANQPPSGADTVSTPCPTSGTTTPGAMAWPITNWVKLWAAGTPNYGVALRGPSESLSTGQAYRVTFHSSEMTGTGATPPKLIVQYFLPPEIPTVTAESVDSMDGDHAIVRTSSVKLGYNSSSVDGRNLDYYLSVLDSTAPLPSWTTGGGATAQWSFTEGASHSDSTGNGYALVIDSSRSTVIDGKDGKALQLNGAPTAPAFAATSGPVLFTDKSFSAVGWVRVDGTPSSQAGLFSQGDSTGNAFEVVYNPTSRKWTYTMSDSGGSNRATVTSSATAALGTWTHLAAIYDATAHKMRLYVNGTLSGEGNYTSTWNGRGTNGTFMINPYGGLLTSAKVSYDEVRAYQRALSETEIRWMLNLTPPTTANLPSGQTATQTYDVSNVDTFKISVRACLTGVTPTTCSESPYYRITTDAAYVPSNLDTGLSDPANPILTGIVGRPSGGEVTARFYLYDSNGNAVGASPLGEVVALGGHRAALRVPDDVVQAGHTYSWRMQACVDSICSEKTSPVTFLAPGDPSPEVYHPTELTLGPSNFVIKAAASAPGACDGSACPLLDRPAIEVGGMNDDRHVSVVKIKLDSLPDGAIPLRSVLNLGAPTCPRESCPVNARIKISRLNGQVTGETTVDELGAMTDDKSVYDLSGAQAVTDIVGDEIAWLLIESDSTTPVTYGGGTAGSAPTLSLSYLPPGPPSQVEELDVRSGDRGAIVSWALPKDMGSLSVLAGYEVEALSGGTVVKSLETEEPSTTLSGLDNGATYTVRVRAKSRFGTGEWRSASVTPQPVQIVPPAGSLCPGITRDAFTQRSKDYFQLQDKVLEGQASDVWAAGATADDPLTPKWALTNSALGAQRAAMDAGGVQRVDSTVSMHDTVLYNSPNGDVLVRTTVERSWVEVATDSAGTTYRTPEELRRYLDLSYTPCGKLQIIILAPEVDDDATDMILEGPCNESPDDCPEDGGGGGGGCAAAMSITVTTACSSQGPPDGPVDYLFSCHYRGNLDGCSMTGDRQKRLQSGLTLQAGGDLAWVASMNYLVGGPDLIAVKSFGAFAQVVATNKFLKDPKNKYLLKNLNVRMTASVGVRIKGIDPSLSVPPGGGITPTLSRDKVSFDMQGRDGKRSISMPATRPFGFEITCEGFMCWFSDIRHEMYAAVTIPRPGQAPDALDPLMFASDYHRALTVY